MSSLASGIGYICRTGALQQLAERLSRLGVESAEALFSRVELMRTGKNGTAKDSVQAVRLLSELAAFPIGAPDAAAKAARILGDM